MAASHPRTTAGSVKGGACPRKPGALKGTLQRPPIPCAQASREITAFPYRRDRLRTPGTDAKDRDLRSQGPSEKLPTGSVGRVSLPTAPSLASQPTGRTPHMPRQPRMEQGNVPPPDKLRLAWPPRIFSTQVVPKLRVQRPPSVAGWTTRVIPPRLRTRPSNRGLQGTCLVPPIWKRGEAPGRA